jgi:predicted acylesterase/phospholipase RssA/CRP-like cAMP-binding protein
MTEVAAPHPAGSPLFAQVSELALTDLMSDARERHLDAREWLFRAGDPADACYVVVSGRLEVVLECDDGPQVVRILGPGAALGELGVLTRTPRSASARAVRDSRLLELDAERFAAQLDHDPAFAAALARELARQLQASGGLELPDARVAVLAVIGDAAAAFADELARALRRWGSVEVLDGGRIEPDGFAGAVDAAEDRHGYVLLVDGGADGAWSRFCRRQADRVLVVARFGGARDPMPGCDLVLIGVPEVEIGPLLDAVSPRTHHVVAAGEGFPAGVARVARRLTGRSLGVVLSGGGARGFAHIGALGVLADAGFEIDRLGGCSMGSLIAAMSACGWDADEIADRCRTELVRRSPFNDYTLPRVALIRSRKAGAMLDRIFDGLLVEELERPLFTVSADLLSSRLVVHRRGTVVHAVGASMSIPGLAPPVRRLGGLLVDGGVLNNLPVDHMAETEEGPVVALDVIRRLELHGDGEEPPLPSITETLARATVLGSVERAERNRALARLVITPDVQDVPLREWSALDRAVEAGRRAAEESLAQGAHELRALLDARV